jgi:hypothetical protein
MKFPPRQPSAAICGVCSEIEHYLEYQDQKSDKKFTLQRLHRLRSYSAALLGFDTIGQDTISNMRQKALESLSQVKSGI